ncbi:inosine triphosphate pyrophosphatase-like [Spodoptera litura]|uniref:Inosine triphosphate pyrophosphatase n=1 Tax=Spodoptera litura TaxID=69820 RepID=A0A9J7DUN3_SPOLT|nr:inosine triphosphate pyrophosphatase-like [Spodoptera litura]
MIQKAITFVTSNAIKLEEVRAILGNNNPQLEIISRKLDLPELQGEIDEICIKKCQEAARLLKGPVMVEDTSLCYNALKGLPGPYIKWFIYKLGPEGLNNLLTGWDDKSAKAISTFAYCSDCEINVKLFQGVVTGQIVAPRGPSDGFDSIFQPDGFCKTYSELTKAEKYKISHRAQALRKIKEYFCKNNV